MRKKYEKPMIKVETFILSEHIAACVKPIKNKTLAVKEGCNGEVPSLGVTNIFYSKIKVPSSTCTVEGDEMYCYTNGKEDSFVFGS